MKKVLLVAVCVMLAGCEYTVPLVKTPEIEIDKSVVGLWERSRNGGQTERLLILPLGKHEYMVSYPAGSKDAMFARGCLWSGSDIPLVQLDWFGTAQAGLPDNDRTFQFATYKVEGDRVSVRLLNADVVKKDITTSADLAKSIITNRAKPNLFKEAMVFTKVKK